MLTNEQLEERKKSIGSSDVAALFHMDPFKTASEVWLEKTNRLNPDKSKKASRRGHYLEHALLAFAEDELRATVHRKIRVFKGILAANLDGATGDIAIPAFESIVEAKSASDYAPDIEQWGKAGTDNVPARVILQTHAQMDCADCAIAHVPMVTPVFTYADESEEDDDGEPKGKTQLGRFEFRMYAVHRNEDIVSAIRETAERFWRDHVVADKQPEDFQVSVETQKRIKREPKSVVTVDEKLIQRWLDTGEMLKKAKVERRNAQENLLTAMGTAEGARCELGLFVYRQENAGDAKVCECGRQISPAKTRMMPRFSANKLAKAR